MELPEDLIEASSDMWNSQSVAQASSDMWNAQSAAQHLVPVAWPSAFPKFGSQPSTRLASLGYPGAWLLAFPLMFLQLVQLSTLQWQCCSPKEETSS